MSYETFSDAAEYLRVEEAAKEKHEYVAGRAFAMSGASFAHNVIVNNLAHLLRETARRSGCFVVTSDMKLKIASVDAYYYPDVMVTCEKPEAGAITVSSPVLLVEVLSPSTMLTDLREKLIAYRTIARVREYLIVRQDEVAVELHRRTEAHWDLLRHGAGQILKLESLTAGQLELPIEAIYEGLDYITA